MEFIQKLLNEIGQEGFWALSELEGWGTDKDGEPQDLENWEIVSITNDRLELLAGGDWQEPKTMCIELIDGELKIVELK